MNDRLEIATRILAPWFNDFIKPEAKPDALCNRALRWADALIAAELASRPKCEHNFLAWKAGGLVDLKTMKPVCTKCGEVKP